MRAYSILVTSEYEYSGIRGRKTGPRLTKGKSVKVEDVI